MIGDISLRRMKVYTALLCLVFAASWVVILHNHIPHGFLYPWGFFILFWLCYDGITVNQKKYRPPFRVQKVKIAVLEMVYAFVASLILFALVSTFGHHYPGSNPFHVIEFSMLLGFILTAFSLLRALVRRALGFTTHWHTPKESPYVEQKRWDVLLTTENDNSNVS